ncbi:MAG: M28 family peptidase [Bacteroidota bacterium]
MDELVELLKKQQKRFNKKEKDAFIKFLISQLISSGYDYEIIESNFFGTKHVATKSDNNPSVIFLAHYDTATTLPIWVEWLLRVFGHTRNLLTLSSIVLIFHLISLTNNALIINLFYAIAAGSILISMIMIVNKNTMNDNTSGVLVLLLLLNRIAKQEDLKKKVKFVFTDNEEKFLAGSFQLKRKWNQRGFNYGNRIISVDSVGSGDNIIISYNFISKLSNELKTLFSRIGYKVKNINMFFMPFSDAYSFWRTGAVNINMMYQSILPGGYYIKNIHSKRDKVINKENISMLVDALEEYVKTVC